MDAIAPAKRPTILASIGRRLLTRIIDSGIAGEKWGQTTILPRSVLGNHCHDQVKTNE